MKTLARWKPKVSKHGNMVYAWFYFSLRASTVTRAKELLGAASGDVHDQYLMAFVKAT
jgi:hypothetical protein